MLPNSAGGKIGTSQAWGRIVKVAPLAGGGLEVARCRFSSAIMVRQIWSATRRFRHRLASRGVLPSAILLR